MNKDGWTELNTTDNVVHIKFPSGSRKLGKLENL